jgi:His-Xaa-Ser system radical SAM maturase HxsB
VDRRSLTVSLPELAAEQLGFFRWGRVAGKVLVTNDAGDWAFLSEPELNDLLAGRIAAGHARFEELQRKGFVRDGLDLDALAARMAQRSRHVRRGAHLHILTLTLRGGQRAAQPAQGGDVDMSRATAEQIVEFALQSTSPSIAFELQGEGGEPLLNLEVLRHLVEFVRRRNEQAAGKILRFRVISNFTAMSEEIAEWLLANDVRVTTSLDGPASVHDWNRTWKGGSAHADVVRWIDYFRRRSGELGRDARTGPVDALSTTTRPTLDAWREVIDEYVARGMRVIHLQPLDRWRVDRDAWAKIGYSAAEYLEFYRRALDYILELNRRGVDIAERTASIIASKILAADDPGVVDIQSPSGSGTGQIAYDVDGRVFPCDDARAMGAMGDSIFDLGHVRQLSLMAVARHATVRAIAAASLLDAQPMCADCWNKPFCGFSPVRNYLTQGDLFGQRPRCFECKEHMAISAQLFELLANGDDVATADVLKRWANDPATPVGGGRVSQQAP